MNKQSINQSPEYYGNIETATELSLTLSRFQKVRVSFVQRLSEFELRGADGGSVRSAERDLDATKSLVGGTAKPRSPIQLTSALSDE